MINDKILCMWLTKMEMCICKRIWVFIERICIKYWVELALVYYKCGSRNIQNCRKRATLNYEAVRHLPTTRSLYFDMLIACLSKNSCCFEKCLVMWKMSNEVIIPIQSSAHLVHFNSTYQSELNIYISSINVLVILYFMKLLNLFNFLLPTSIQSFTKNILY